MKMVCEVFTTGTPPQRADTPLWCGISASYLCNECCQQAKGEQVPGNPVQMSPGALEHQAEPPEEITSCSTGRVRNVLFKVWPPEGRQSAGLCVPTGRNLLSFPDRTTLRSAQRCAVQQATRGAQPGTCLRSKTFTILKSRHPLVGVYAGF